MTVAISPLRMARRRPWRRCTDERTVEARACVHRSSIDSPIRSNSCATSFITVALSVCGALLAERCIESRLRGGHAALCRGERAAAERRHVLEPLALDVT